MGGAHPKKKPKKTSRYTKIGKLALVFFGFFKFPNWHWFFLVFFWFFFGIGFGQNSKLETGFFCFFLAFFGFFWHRPWPTFEIGNWFFGLRWFFLVFFLVFLGFFGFFLVFKCRVRISSQKTPKKKPKKTKKKPKKPKKNQKNQSLHQNW